MFRNTFSLCNPYEALMQSQKRLVLNPHCLKEKLKQLSPMIRQLTPSVHVQRKQLQDGGVFRSCWEYYANDRQPRPCHIPSRVAANTDFVRNIKDKKAAKFLEILTEPAKEQRHSRQSSAKTSQASIQSQTQQLCQNEMYDEIYENLLGCFVEPKRTKENRPKRCAKRIRKRKKPAPDGLVRKEHLAEVGEKQSNLDNKKPEKKPDSTVLEASMPLPESEPKMKNVGAGLVAALRIELLQTNSPKVSFSLTNLKKKITAETMESVLPHPLQPQQRRVKKTESAPEQLKPEKVESSPEPLKPEQVESSTEPLKPEKEIKTSQPIKQKKRKDNLGKKISNNIVDVVRSKDNATSYKVVKHPRESEALVTIHEKQIEPERKYSLGSMIDMFPEEIISQKSRKSRQSIYSGKRKGSKLKKESSTSVGSKKVREGSSIRSTRITMVAEKEISPTSKAATIPEHELSSTVKDTNEIGKFKQKRKKKRHVSIARHVPIDELLSTTPKQKKRSKNYQEKEVSFAFAKHKQSRKKRRLAFTDSNKNVVEKELPSTDYDSKSVKSELSSILNHPKLVDKDTNVVEEQLDSKKRQSRKKKSKATAAKEQMDTSPKEKKKSKLRESKRRTNIKPRESDKYYSSIGSMVDIFPESIRLTSAIRKYRNHRTKKKRSSIDNPTQYTKLRKNKLLSTFGLRRESSAIARYRKLLEKELAHGRRKSRKSLMKKRISKVDDQRKSSYDLPLGMPKRSRAKIHKLTSATKIKFHRRANLYMPVISKSEEAHHGHVLTRKLVVPSYRPEAEWRLGTPELYTNVLEGVSEASLNHIRKILSLWSRYTARSKLSHADSRDSISDQYSMDSFDEDYKRSSLGRRNITSFENFLDKLDIFEKSSAFFKRYDFPAINIAEYKREYIRKHNFNFDISKIYAKNWPMPIKKIPFQRSKPKPEIPIIRRQLRRRKRRSDIQTEPEVTSQASCELCKHVYRQTEPDQPYMVQMKKDNAKADLKAYYTRMRQPQQQQQQQQFSSLAPVPTVVTQNMRQQLMQCSELLSQCDRMLDDRIRQRQYQERCL